MAAGPFLAGVVTGAAGVFLITFVVLGVEAGLRGGIVIARWARRAAGQR